MEDPTWQVIHNYFSQGGGSENANPLVQHQIESYNEFIDKKLSQIIQGFNPIQICHNYKESVKDFGYKIYMTITNPSLSKPIIQSQDGSQQLMTPHLARMNGLTYSVSLYTDVHIVTETINDDNVNRASRGQGSKRDHWKDSYYGSFQGVCAKPDAWSCRKQWKTRMSL